ncbi:MAG TPA: hypothetical protein VNZ49_09910 [Bacteroidia bacterium]|nr:hypothetical protein [Bacteroidia bacterium]
MNLKNEIENFWAPALKITEANRLRKALFAYMLFNSVQLILAKDILFNAKTSLILPGHINEFSVTMLVNLLTTEAFRDYFGVFIFVQQLFSFVGFFDFLPRISSFVIFFTAVNLQNRIYATTSGGDILAYILLFYLSFVSGGKELKTPNLNQIQNSFNRIFIFLCYFQVILVYAVSAIYKLMSPEWINGNALYRILSVSEYSLPFIQNHIDSLSGFLKVCTWLALLYQLLFPLLIFNRRIKNYLLIGGLVLHSGIALAMGLLNFSLVMVCCYALFYDFKSKGQKMRVSVLS